jgi:hypothetical protein
MIAKISSFCYLALSVRSRLGPPYGAVSVRGALQLHVLLISHPLCLLSSRASIPPAVLLLRFLIRLSPRSSPAPDFSPSVQSAELSSS